MPAREARLRILRGGIYQPITELSKRTPRLPGCGVPAEKDRGSAGALGAESGGTTEGGLRHIELHPEIRKRQVGRPRLESQSAKRGRPAAGLMAPRVAAIYADLLANPLAHHAEISTRHGVSRERVRQIAKEYLQETGLERFAKRKLERAAARVPGHFPAIVKRWLRAFGYGYCGVSSHEGGRVLSASNFSNERRCKSCAAAAMRHRWATNEQWREYAKQFTKKQAARGYFKEYAAKNRDRIKRRLRERYWADPEKSRAKAREANKKKYYKDLEVTRAKNRERYHVKKRAAIAEATA